MADIWEAYNYSNITGIFDTIEYANSVTDSLFGVGLVMSFYMVTFISLRGFGDDRAFAAANFMALILAIILRAGSLIGDIFVLILVLLNLVAVVFLNMD